MKRIILITLLIPISIFLYAQRDISSTLSYSPYLDVMKDPATGVIWKSVCVNVTTSRRTGFRSFQKSATLEFLSNTKDEHWELEMRLTMNTDLNDWPIDETAYLGVNGYAIKIKLSDIQSKIYHIKDNNETTDTAGIVITNVSTRDFQLFRKEANMTNAFIDIYDIKSLQLIIYFGGKPVILEFSHYDIQKVQAILK